MKTPFPRRWAVASLVAIAAAMTFASAAAAVEMRTFGKPFCEGKPVHDYERVFDEMPPVRHVPSSERLPFGPPDLSIYQSAASRVIVGRGGFGYRFSDETYGVRRRVVLHWDVTTTLSRVNRMGEAVRTIASETQYLGVETDIGDRSFWLDTPPGPAFYRYDIEFRDHRSGEALGTFAEYLRVVRPTFRPRLAVNRRTFSPGQTAYARVENRGTEWISFGLVYRIERFEGGRWVLDPASPDGPWFAVGLGMGSGGSGWCMRFAIPADATRGRYRFVRRLDRWWSRRGGKKATAEFRVLVART